jgi:hypothetical protein
MTTIKGLFELCDDDGSSRFVFDCISFPAEASAGMKCTPAAKAAAVAPAATEIFRNFLRDSILSTTSCFSSAFMAELSTSGMIDGRTVRTIYADARISPKLEPLKRSERMFYRLSGLRIWENA